MGMDIVQFERSILGQRVKTRREYVHAGSTAPSMAQTVLTRCPNPERSPMYVSIIEHLHR